MKGCYWCYRCYIISTGGELISDTVQFFPIKVAMLALSSQDNTTDAICDIITILRNTGPTTPFLEYGPKDKTAVENWLTFLEPT